MNLEDLGIWGIRKNGTCSQDGSALVLVKTDSFDGHRIPGRRHRAAPEPKWWVG